MRKWTRKFRLFGHGAPSTFLVPCTVDNRHVDWKTATTTSSLEGVAQLHLDAVYDDLRVGTELLVVSGNTASGVMVSQVSQQLAKIEGVHDNTTARMPGGEASVTCVRWDGDPIEALDTRPTVIYELRGPELRFADRACVTPMPVGSIQLPASVATYVDDRLASGSSDPPSDLCEHLWSDTIRLLGEYDGQLPLPGPLLDALLAEAERASGQGETGAVTVKGLIDPKCTGRAPIWGDVMYVPLKTLERIEAGRRIILDDATHRPETVTVLNAAPYCPEGEEQRPEYLRIVFTPALSRVLDGTTAVLYGNVAPASHGETIRDEILGDGDPSVPYQSFELAKAPVAHLPQPDASGGVRSTLEVWVNEVRWGEVPSLYSCGPDARVYATVEDEDGSTTIRFGDGKSGARLPRGRANIVARYRQGLGREGEVPAGALTTLLDRPVGLKSVTNAAPGSDGAGPKSVHSVRADAPNTVRTFDRVVSLRDFEDVARAYPGIAKAKAACTWDEGQRAVLLTVAGDDGDRIEEAARRDLRAHLDARRDRYRPLLIRRHEPVAVAVEVGIWVAPDRSPDVVQQATLEALEAYFAFDTQDLGKTIHLSGLYAVIRAVEGVAGSDIDHLGYKVDTIAQLPKTAAPHLPMESWQIAYVEGPADLTVDVRTNGL
jgi:hypothetical protein